MSVSDVIPADPDKAWNTSVWPLRSFALLLDMAWRKSQIWQKCTTRAFWNNTHPWMPLATVQFCTGRMDNSVCMVPYIVSHKRGAAVTKLPSRFLFFSSLITNSGLPSWLAQKLIVALRLFLPSVFKMQTFWLSTGNLWPSRIPW